MSVLLVQFGQNCSVTSSETSHLSSSCFIDAPSVSERIGRSVSAASVLHLATSASHNVRLGKSWADFLPNFCFIDSPQVSERTGKCYPCIAPCRLHAVTSPCHCCQAGLGMLTCFALASLILWEYQHALIAVRKVLPWHCWNLSQTFERARNRSLYPSNQVDNGIRPNHQMRIFCRFEMQTYDRDL